VVFRAQWRPYQARVLSEMEEHLGDNRLHIVAAPGSGKTLLGLEVVRRLDRPTLIIAPTLAIRDQWITRFLDFYTDTPSNVPEWISTDLRNPGFLTVTTYQGLYSVHTGRSDEYGDDNAESSSEEGGDVPEDDQSVECMTNPDEVVSLFTRTGLQTIVLDEAHHLRVNWWRCLNSLLKSFPDATTVSLTATPPYDVSAYEWERYVALCGPIDSEISIPELVREGNLCPHQDLLMLTLPSSEESEKSRRFRESIQQLIDELQSNDEFATLIQNHPWVTSPNDHIEELLDDTAFFSSMLVFLRHKGLEIPKSCSGES
jgi:superfamily II DNA or RNA helicase